MTRARAAQILRQQPAGEADALSVSRHAALRFRSVADCRLLADGAATAGVSARSASMAISSPICRLRERRLKRRYRPRGRRWVNRPIGRGHALPSWCASAIDWTSGIWRTDWELAEARPQPPIASGSVLSAVALAAALLAALVGFAARGSGAAIFFGFALFDQPFELFRDLQDVWPCDSRRSRLRLVADDRVLARLVAVCAVAAVVVAALVAALRSRRHPARTRRRARVLAATRRRAETSLGRSSRRRRRRQVLVAEFAAAEFAVRPSTRCSRGYGLCGT